MANYLGGGGFNPEAYMMRKLMDDLFKDKTPENKAEASTLATLVNSANSQEAFDNLSPILAEWSKRNDTMGEDVQAIEAVLMPAFESKKEKYGKLKQATMDSNKLLDPTYYISEADKTRALAGGTDVGGIQNIKKEDVAGWTYDRMAKESDAINTILDGFAGGKGMTFNIKGAKYDTQQLKRHMADYKSTLDAGLQMAYYSGTIPDDPRIIRAIMEGKSDVVDQIRKQEVLNQKQLYTQYNKQISDLYETKSKVDAKIGDVTDSVKQNQMLFSMLAGQSGDKDWDKYMAEHPDTIAQLVKGLDATSLNYETFSENIKKQIGGADGAGGLVGARQSANERYKKYEGMYIEGVDVAMEKELPLMFGGLPTPPTPPGAPTPPTPPGTPPPGTPPPGISTPVIPAKIGDVSEYVDIVGVPDVGKGVDDMDYFQNLEAAIVAAKLGKEGKGKGYRVLNRIKKTYQQKLDYTLKGYGHDEKRSGKEYWNKRAKQALDSFLRSKRGAGLLKVLEDLIQKKLPEDRKNHFVTSR